MIRCPACKAENEQGPNCRRCKADVSPLFALEARREALLRAAKAQVAARRWAAAHQAAAEADVLRRDDESLRLVALTALLCDDFHLALRAYLAQPSKR